MSGGAPRAGAGPPAAPLLPKGAGPVLQGTVDPVGDAGSDLPLSGAPQPDLPLPGLRARTPRGADASPRPAPFVALFVAGLMLFNFPLLLVWDQPVTVFGLPLLGVALFAIWAGLIVILALVSERRGGRG